MKYTRTAFPSAWPCLESGQLGLLLLGSSHQVLGMQQQSTPGLWDIHVPYLTRPCWRKKSMQWIFFKFFVHILQKKYDENCHQESLEPLWTILFHNRKRFLDPRVSLIIFIYLVVLYAPLGKAETFLNHLNLVPILLQKQTKILKNHITYETCKYAIIYYCSNFKIGIIKTIYLFTSKYICTNKK